MNHRSASRSLLRSAAPAWVGAARRVLLVTLAAAGVTLGLTATVVSESVAQPAVAVRGLPDFTELVEQVGPSVVNIRTSQKVRAGRAGSDEMDQEMQEFFRRFFGVPIPAPRQAPRRSLPQDDAEQEVPRGVGSGFVVSADGYVLTNAHVIDGADEVYVTLADKREFKAKVVGADARTDVAVVKIEAAGLVPVKVGDVGRVKVGEWVMAIGSPFGLENTVTAGIVSAKARDTGEFLPFIQTDVAINPGNSGGPLINMRGEVIGINSQILSRSGGFMGISFSIPIDEATRVADQLRTSGKVSRGRIGVQIDQVTKDVAESLGLPKATGALVRAVEAGGPADKAGLEAGDIVLKFDGKVVEKASDLARIVANTKPGTRTTTQVFRRGKSRDLPVTVAEMPGESSARTSAAPQRSGSAPSAATLGLAVSDLTDAQKRELRIRGGVRVDAVDGAAARAGLREGDIVLAIGNVEVADAKQFEAVIAKVDRNKAVSLLIRRGDWAQYVLIRPAR